MTTGDALIIEYLQSLPMGSVIQWWSVDVGQDSPFDVEYCEVQLSDPALQDRLRAECLWIVHMPGDGTDDEPSLCVFPWEPDLDVHIVITGNALGQIIAAETVPRGRPLSDAQWRHLDTAMHTDHGVIRMTDVGWSPSAISHALQWWTGKHAQRPDLVFEWDMDHPTPAPVEAEARPAEQSYRIGENLMVPSGFIDMLLGVSPGVAAQVTTALNKAADQQQSGPQNGWPPPVSLN